MGRFVKHAVLFIVLAAIAAICYGPYLNTFFACDDFKYLENIVVGGPKAISLGYNAQMRLVSNWAWVPLYWISGTDPIAYNLFNAALAAINGLLFYVFIRKLTGVEILSMVAAALFVMSSSAADAIFWKANVSGLLSCTFSLATLYLYLLYRQSENRSYYFSSIGIFLLAIFSKEDAACVIPLLFVIELLYLRKDSTVRQVAVRAIPYVLVILFFLVSTSLTYHYFHLKSETWGWFKIRPLYALFGGFAAFFIHPDGVLSLTDPRIYLTGAALVLALVLIRDRKLLIFGCLWIVLTFLPSSFTSIGVFQPTSFTSSPSRFFYLPSAGVALVLAALFHRFASQRSTRFYYSAAGVLLACLLVFNARRIHQRGDVWTSSASHAQHFLAAMKQLAPEVPPRSFLVIESRYKPVGWMWQALKVIYRRGDISGGRDLPDRIAPDQCIFLVRCDPATVIPYQVVRLQ